MEFSNDAQQMPARFRELKHKIAAQYPDFENKATTAWGEILEELAKVSKEIKAAGSNVRLESVYVAAGTYSG